MPPRHLARATALLGALAALGALACSDGTAPSPRLRLTASVDSLVLGVGDTARVEALVLVGDDRVRAGDATRWHSLDPTVASIDEASGRAIAVAPGRTSLVATAGAMADTVPLRVTRRIATLSVTLAADSVLLGGGSVRGTVVARDAGGAIIDAPALRWDTPDTLTLDVASNGTVFGFHVGTGRVRAHAGSLSAEASVRVVFRRLSFGGVRPVQLSIGQVHGCALDAEGVAYCWGDNSYGPGMVGRGVSGSGPFPFGPVATSERFASIEAQEMSSCGLTTTGRLLCWGSNSIPRRSNVPVPILDSIPTRSFTVGQHNQACAIAAADGVLRCWGHNDFYQLARGPLASYDTLPRPATGDVRFSQVKVGILHGCGLATDGKAWCWGYINGFRDGSGIPADRPVEQPGGMTFTQLEVIANGPGACALTAAGEAWCWGYNGSFGALGGGTDSTYVRTPVRVQGGLTFVRLDGGWEHMCGITAAGEVWCWGAPAFGHSTVPGSPRRFAANHTFRTFASSAHGVCGITADEQVLCSGNVPPTP